MAGPMGEEVDSVMAQLQGVRSAADDATREMSEISHTQMSKRKLFSVTVGAAGELQSLTFNGEKYRTLAPVELAQLIVDTVAEAKEICQAEASKVLSTYFPEETGDTDLLGSVSSLDEMMSGFMKAAGAGFTDDEIKEFQKSWESEK